MSYHHGDLPAAILDAAARSVLRDGSAALSLRALAREVGVSHTAPRHHFGDKRGVLTALAAQGYRDLVAALTRADGFLEAGVAYVRYAVEHPGHYSVMFRPDLVRADEPEHLAALTRLRAVLTAGASERAEDEGGAAVQDRGRAAWSMAHGFATLALAGNFRATEVEEICELARHTLRQLGAG